MRVADNPAQPAAIVRACAASQPCCAHGNEDGKRRLPEIPCDWPARPPARQKEHHMEKTDHRRGRLPDDLMSGKKKPARAGKRAERRRPTLAETSIAVSELPHTSGDRLV